jgi:hypothetical protein
MSYAINPYYRVEYRFWAPNVIDESPSNPSLRITHSLARGIEQARWDHVNEPQFVHISPKAAVEVLREWMADPLGHLKVETTRWLESQAAYRVRLRNQ